jgi:hypothetical protein
LYRTELEGTVFTPVGPLKLKLRRTDPAQSEGWKIVEQSGPSGVDVVLSTPKRSGHASDAKGSLKKERNR